MSALGMILGAAIALYGVYLIFTSVNAIWGDACPQCGYSYRGLPAAHRRCPECGVAIDRETQGYVERKPAQLVVGLLLLVVGSGAFGASMILL